MVSYVDFLYSRRRLSHTFVTISFGVGLVCLGGLFLYRGFLRVLNPYLLSIWLMLFFFAALADPGFDWLRLTIHGVLRNRYVSLAGTLIWTQFVTVLTVLIAVSVVVLLPFGRSLSILLSAMAVLVGTSSLVARARSDIAVLEIESFKFADSPVPDGTYGSELELTVLNRGSGSSAIEFASVLLVSGWSHSTVQYVAPNLRSISDPNGSNEECQAIRAGSRVVCRYALDRSVLPTAHTMIIGIHPISGVPTKLWFVYDSWFRRRKRQLFKRIPWCAAQAG